MLGGAWKRDYQLHRTPDAFNMSELYGRVKEIAMRVSMIVAASCRARMSFYLSTPGIGPWGMLRNIFKTPPWGLSRLRVTDRGRFKKLSPIIKNHGLRGATQDISTKSVCPVGLTRSSEAILLNLECTGVELKTIEHVKADAVGLPVYPEEGE